MVLREPHRSRLRAHLEAHAAEYIGEPHVFPVITETQEWLEENFAAAVTSPPTEAPPKAAASSAVAARVDAVDDAVEMARVIAAASAAAREIFPDCPRPGARGQWKYVVGLVGKPSAGKSTFFNAVTKPASAIHAAKVAAHPFTTILPNVGTSPRILFFCFFFVGAMG
jgi:hypothetical protein